ncbi:DUF4153 domain-containing protein [Brevundimonas lenta]|uniref:DUF4173 domain-containing protein n=1 Tax=Brevundimonas lenta TaxID=424796 RepID=A0A7W6NPJ1_9CAUL|nr:DUF4173 domain-containing protein [Brevundimonas lenta]MBB4082220.1 hypothetical protein [Brevundimonas lenta]
MLQTHPFTRSSFWLKVVAGVALVAAADALFFFHPVGATVGAFALTWALVVAIVRPGLLKDPRALSAMAGAAGLAVVLIDRPGVLAWLLFGLMLSLAVLSARVRKGEPAWRWLQRLIVQSAVAFAGPALDMIRLSRRRSRRPGVSPVAVLKVLIVPLIGGAVFLGLFASANPLIAGALDSVRVPAPGFDGVQRALWWSVALVTVGATLRPRWRRKLIDLPSLRGSGVPGVGAASVTLSLIVFNAVFALQNGLDIAFLWSGAPLPGDIGLSDYAHKGAWTLMATALLAGVFVLVALRPGSETARKPLVRALVIVWVGQTLLLVASSIYRTADYIESYALTRFRIAALIWMAMVAIGLLLICWRLIRDKDGHWLIDANVRLVLVVLVIVSVVDLGAVAAWWNVRHAREVGGRGVELDLGYLRTLGAPALVSLVELEQTAPDPGLRDRAAAVRAEIHAQVRAEQADWRSWTWRDARRLDRVDRLAAGRPLARPTPGPREWDGRLRPPPPPPAIAPVVVSAPVAYEVAPLTSPPGV